MKERTRIEKDLRSSILTQKAIDEGRLDINDELKVVLKNKIKDLEKKLKGVRE